MSFGIRHLRSFMHTAQERHFGRAAHKLHLTQPALSRTIRHLEMQLGGALFVRSTRHVELTELGAIFLPVAKTAVASFDAACAAGQQAARGEVGHILVGHTEIAIFGQVPRILRRFRALYPQTTVSLVPGITNENIERVARGEIDAAFVTNRLDSAALDCVSLWTEGSVVLLPLHHRLARRRAVHLSDLVDEPFVLGPSATWQSYRPRLEEACRQSGYSPRVVQEADSTSALVRLVASGEGITVHPASVRNISAPEVVIRDLVDASLHVETCLITRKSCQSKLVENFRKTATDCCGIGQTALRCATNRSSARPGSSVMLAASKTASSDRPSRTGAGGRPQSSKSARSRQGSF